MLQEDINENMSIQNEKNQEEEIIKDKDEHEHDNEGLQEIAEDNIVREEESYDE